MDVADPAGDLIAGWYLLSAGARRVFCPGRGRPLSSALQELSYHRAAHRVMASNARHVTGEILADVDGPGVG